MDSVRSLMELPEVMVEEKKIMSIFNDQTLTGIRDNILASQGVVLAIKMWLQRNIIWRTCSLQEKRKRILVCTQLFQTIKIKKPIFQLNCLTIAVYPGWSHTSRRQKWVFLSCFSEIWTTKRNYYMARDWGLKTRVKFYWRGNNDWQQQKYTRFHSLHCSGTNRKLLSIHLDTSSFTIISAFTWRLMSLGQSFHYFGAFLPRIFLDMVTFT